MASKDLIMTFLGTGAMKPSLRRGTSAIGMLVPTKQGSESWLFDCGEGTFRQLCFFNRSSKREVVNHPKHSDLSSYRLGCNKLNRVFITHLHGDHIFGLPSVILGINFEKNPDVLREEPIYLYGPPGLGRFVSTCFSTCDSRISCHLNITELCTANQSCSTIPTNDVNYSHISVHPLYPNDKGEWECLSEGFGRVVAGELSHNVTTFGYSYFESDQPGNVNADIVMPLLNRNRTEIEVAGKSIYDILKRFKEGESIVLPDQTVLDPLNRDLLSEVKKGRHITILGDTRSAQRMSKLISGSDVLVHEATVCPLPHDVLEGSNGKDESKQMHLLVKKAHVKGHSTALEAAAFARQMNAKNLVLNHISNRYDFLDDEHYTRVIKEMKELAAAEFGSPDVFIPEDFQSFVLDGIYRTF